MTNPYQQPSADLMPDQAPKGVLTVNPPRARDIGAGWRWFTDAWRVFKSAWGTILLTLLVAWLLSLAVQFVPLLGMLLPVLLAPFLSAGLVCVLYKAEEQRSPTVGDLFAPFSTHFTPLLLLGGLYLLLLVVVMAVAALLGMLLLGGTFSLLMNPETMAQTSGINWQPVMLWGLIVAALFIPVLAAYWFAPALVVLGDQRPVEAMKASLAGCLKNILPMLWYGIIMIVLLVLAMIPFGLGLLLALPILAVTYYSSFRDIYTDTL